jgi:hypothetical protein
MPQTPSSTRWRAVTDLTVEPRGSTPLVFKAGEECKGVPENWPPKWLVDQELVVPVVDDQPGKVGN